MRFQKSNKTVLMLILLACMTFAVSGCGSVAVDRMLAQAQKGITAAENNDNVIFERYKQIIAGEIEQLNRAADRDVEMVSAGVLKDSNGEVVKLDGEWVKQMRVGYYLALKSKYEELQRLDAIQKSMQGNISTLSEMVDESKKLNMGYLTTYQGVGVMLDELNESGVIDISNVTQVGSN